MAKKVLLFGEGPTDYGRQMFGSTEWEEGPVQYIIRKCVLEEIEFINATKKNVRDVKIQRRTGSKLKGHGVKAYQLCVIARELGDIDNIVCYVDADRDQGSSTSAREAKKELSIFITRLTWALNSLAQKEANLQFP